MAEWVNWSRTQRCEPAAVERPATRAELAAAVARATGPVRVAGAGHSFTGGVLTSGTLISLERMNRLLEVDGELVRVEAGITLDSLSRGLHLHGLALPNLGDIDVQSVAGALATGTHGTGARRRNLSAQVEKLELVLGDGSERELTGGDLLRAARVGLGALGVVAAVTLRCVPSFRLRGVDAPEPLDEVLASLDERADAADHFEFWTFPHSPLALTRTNTRTDAPRQAPGRARAWLEDVLVDNHVFGLLNRAGRRWPRAIPALNRTAARAASQRERVDWSYRIFASPRLVRFTEMEYAIPREHAADAVRGAREILARHPVSFPIELRLVAGDDALLSPAYGRDSAYVAVHLFEGDGVGDAVPRGRGADERLRRPSPLGQVVVLGSRGARSALPGVGSLPGRPRRARPGGAVRERLDQTRARPHLGTSRPRRQDQHMVIAAAALLAGLADAALVLSSDHFTDRIWAVFGPVVGWSFVGTGMYARRRRPESRFGDLMILLGFTWFLGGLAAADNGLVFTAGILLGSVWGAVLAHVLFSFPSGRLPAGPARALVIAAYVLVPLAPLPAMLFSTADDLVDCGADCPENLLLVEHDEQLSGALLTAGALMLMILCLLAVWLLVKRWRAAGPAERRSLAPLLGAGAVTLAFVFANAATGAQALYALTFVAFAVMPFAFLAGLVRADLAQARGVRSLVARLADLPDPGDLRSALAAALGDPTLRLAFWVPEQERYVDEQGAAVELPAALLI